MIFLPQLMNLCYLDSFHSCFRTFLCFISVPAVAQKAAAVMQLVKIEILSEHSSSRTNQTMKSKPQILRENENQNRHVCTRSNSY